MKKIVFCENCESIMKFAKPSLWQKEKAQKKLNTHLDISRSQKKLEFLLEIWKCSCPKQTCIVYLLE